MIGEKWGEQIRACYVLCTQDREEDIIAQTSNQMDHIEPLYEEQSNVLCNGHDIHFNYKMRSFNIRSFMCGDVFGRPRRNWDWL